MDYLLCNIAHARHNRTARAALPKNPRMKQYVGDKQHRLIAGRPVIVSEEMVQRNLEELRLKSAAHMIELRTRDGRVIDLKTMEPMPAAPSVLLPHPLQDSVANDKKWDYPPGWKFVATDQSADGVMPEVLKSGEKPSLFGEATPDATEPVTDAPVTDAPEAVSTDADLEAALAAAQAEAAPTAEEGVPSNESARRGRRSR